MRTLLAIAVVFAHSYGFIFVGGRNAVQLFYTISGFLISYVLVERKAYNTISSFYINRYLRLYPIYFAVAMFTLFVYMTSSAAGLDIDFFQIYYDAPLAANLLLLFSNVLIFMQDWVMFAGVDNNQLVFSANFTKSEVVLWPALLVPQAWTLGVELTFYLIAPFVLPKRRVLYVFIALSISLRIYLIHIGLGWHDPWTYRFFPTELAFFLLGAMAHQVLLPYYRTKLTNDRLEKYARASTLALVIITITYWIIPVSEPIKTTGLFIVFLMLMPLAFIFQANRKWDQRIGDLSYPIYICHMCVIHLINVLFGKIGVTEKWFYGMTAVVGSVCFSMILNYYIGRPIESLRNRYRTGINPSRLPH
ncbi:MAG TPA: acyltransferase [Thiobacillaceae bacterium]|nr:acyltransferase [Thiobacillaceae bacterium]